MRISIFGLGYVGCVSLGCLAQNGHTVVGVDLQPLKVKYINNGKATIIEKKIEKIIDSQYRRDKISATTKGISAVRSTDVSIICVGTPSTQNGHLNLNAVYNVAEEIGRGLKEKEGFHVIVIRSTVLPGTNMKVGGIVEKFSGKKNDLDFAIVSNPEFLREGTAVDDYFNPPYTLIGSNNEAATKILRKVYADINARFVETDILIAELIKYVNNAFHALKIVFANEVGNICKKLNIDSHELMGLFCMDEKLNISAKYLNSGFAYGGSCLPKDLNALNTIAHDFYLECPVLENIPKSNELHSKYVASQIISFKKKFIGFLGLSFKAGTDDLRHSPIIDIIEQLIGKGYKIKIYDNNVHLSNLVGANKEYISEKIPYISKFIFSKPETVINDSELLVVVNKEEEFETLLNKVPKDKIIFDLVNIDFKEKHNKNYYGISW